MAINKIELKRVTKSDIDFLYELLSERTSIESISHKKLPTKKQHVKFVNSNPYSKWYIIKLNNAKIGSVYLTQINEIGISIIKKFESQNIRQLILLKLFEKNPQERYLANINPKNKDLKLFFKKNGFKLIQYTYELSK